ncbi:novel immune-type receptor 5 isoform X1 [Megalobrama amblycephala]|uniref:novel immune-type receptor 5 isoform X1 n=1 Tax=Megalobrama amblycephala TaxID=75352 RepID=UPI002013C39B|nr:novel immune-type receptor 5 isoform X1 [Megalobrama amblycephala]
MGKQLCVMIFLLYEAFTIHGDIKQQDSVLSVHEGDTVILSCSISTKQISVVSWYKQVTGEEPRLIASSLLQSSESQFHNGFDRNHFEVLRETDNFNLKIVNTVQSDSGTYYCAVSFSNIIEFGNGTLLVIKGSEASRPTHLQPPKFELVESEVNVPLQCSIQNQLESGRGEHRLYWFRHGSGESPSGSIYIHGNTSDSCVKSSEAGCLSPTCVFNLPKKTFSSSEKGTYFCALATCGEALFGNISNLNPDSHESQNIHLIQIGLAALLAISLTINVLLCCLRKNGRKSQQIQTTDEDDNDDVSINQNRELTYATVLYTSKHSRVKRVSGPEDTLYSGLACQQQS